MYFTHIVFTTVLAVVACQTKTKILLKTEFKIELDEDCVQDKIGTDKYNSLTYIFAKCTTDPSYLRTQDTANVDRNIEAFCGNKDNVKACFQEVTETITPCLTENQKNSLKYNVDSKMATMAYACENRALLKDSLMEDNSKCGTPEYIGRAAKCLPPLTPGMITQSEYSKEKCRMQETFTKCAADNLRSCSGEATSKLSIGSFYAGANATPCKDYVGSGSNIRLNFVLFAIIIIMCCLQNFFF